jgi:hypothetical protein
LKRRTEKPMLWLELSVAIVDAYAALRMGKSWVPPGSHVPANV